MLVSLRKRKRRKPGFAADGPEFVGRRELVRGIQGTQVHFDLVRTAPEDNRLVSRHLSLPDSAVETYTAHSEENHAATSRGSVQQGATLLLSVFTAVRGYELIIALPEPLPEANGLLVVNQVRSALKNAKWK